jgi:hypothetical protein
MPPIVALAPGSIGKKRPVPLSSVVQLLARDARLHAAIEILGADLEHLVHLREVHADAARQRGDVAFERRPDAERDHRYPRGVAQPDDRGDFVVRPRKHHDIGQRRVGKPFSVAVTFADRLRGHCPLAIVGG